MIKTYQLINKICFYLGCGKTALIQFLCQKILDDDLEVFRVHAGVSSDNIIKTMQDYRFQAERSAKQNKRLWIFFDEFNTTINIGLLKEIICERTLLGEPLPTNMVFLGACNPRREKTLKIQHNEDAYIGLRKNRYEIQRRIDAGTDRRLLYTVVPIPETMLEYIWDYGYLNEPTERAYISTMLKSCRDLYNDQNLFKLTIELLVQSHNHFRSVEDASSVSLRDIARFCRLYNWFLDSLNKRINESTIIQRSFQFQRRASLSALMLCYYFRLRSAKRKEIYVEQMQMIMAEENPNLKKVPNYLTKYILEFEQKTLIDDKMELPEGTALNRALRDNIFVLLACIVNRIPLFLCGKPGSSKSSAVQILISNLRGLKSKDEYFQTLPELVAVSFQGSQNCTSESIIKVFERAANYTRVKGQSELLPVIVFDEIGLAELSPHNPLKVLHAELEVENNRYGFVGISNWRLDASKMNRALYLSTPDPTVEDLQLTGKTIFTSMQKQLDGQIVPLEPIIIESLSQAYYDLLEIMRGTQADQENYFGLRDYYSLIKGIARDLVSKKNNGNIYEIIRRQLKVNFDGVLDGSFLLWQQFCAHINQDHLLDQYKSPSFDSLLDQTLDNRTGRYLMLIAESESAIDYVERFIHLHQQKHGIGVRTLVGSSFPGDLLSGNTYAEQYNYRVLMDVILYAETNVTLIMRQMGDVYDNLYDLFNQNFAVSARKKYCRIALGPLYHPRCLIHDGFYCVVFILKRDADKCDPPFLNRFEKHLIDIEALIHPRHKFLTNQLHAWLTSLLPNNLGKHFPLFQHLFVNYSQDQICNLVIETFEELNIPVDGDEQNDLIINHCRAKLLRTSSFDLPLVLSLQPTPENKNLIDEYYDSRQSLTFPRLIEESLRNEKNILPRVIYTYTQIYDPMEKLPKSVEAMKLSAFKTELELTNRIKVHYQGSTKILLLLIQVDYHNEHEHILSLKHILLNEYVKESDRNIWVIFHLQRNLLNQINNDVLFNNWSNEMIDDLNNGQCMEKDVLFNPSYRNLLLQPQCVLSKSMFNEPVDRCLSKFRYNVPDKNDEQRINTRRHSIFQNLIEEKPNAQLKGLHLRTVFHETLSKLIDRIEISNNRRFNDWRIDLLTNGLTIVASRSFSDALETTISTFYETYIFLLLAHLEKYHFIDSYSHLLKINDVHIREDLSQLWINCLNTTLEKIDTTVINRDMMEIELNFNLNLPCATTEYENIENIRKKIDQLGQNETNSIDHFNFARDQLRATSYYGKDFIESVFTNERFFHLYFHDQISIHLSQRNIHLTPKFTFYLMTMNPKHSLEENARALLTQHQEFTEILRLFEIALKLTNEQEISDVIENQFIENPPNQIKPSKYYSLIISNQQFYQLPPGITRIEDRWIFKCNGNPMIEIVLMNLIELILSSTIISRTNSIEQIFTTYSLIAQSVRNLPSYEVNNLEKLRSFLSLTRCLIALIPQKALELFKDVTKQEFNGKFQSCQSIDQFVTRLCRNIEKERSPVNENTIHRTLIKLEVDFLKDWLADNEDSYGDILTLINQNNNDLWQYSAKIFTYIDRKYDLSSTSEENHGIIPLNEDIEVFNRSLQKANKGTYKVERLLLNRFHMHLMKSASADQINQQLIHFNKYFIENFRQIQNIKKVEDLQTISILSWLKYYTQIYAFALNKDSRENVLHEIDQLLTNTNTPIGSTIKLFIVKQLLQISGINVHSLREIYVNRNVTWIKPFIQRPRDEHAQEIRRNLILPTPLFECREQFQHISRILNEPNKKKELSQIIRDCANSPKLTYAFLIWFIQYYCRFLQPNTDLDQTFIQLIENDLQKELIRSFTSIGHRFVLSLCRNFFPQSYYHLQPEMELNTIHKRLVSLNIIAVLISNRSSTEMTLLANLLFDNRQEMPKNYRQHLSTICLLGLTINDPVITQMIDVHMEAEDRLSREIVHDGGKFLFQCSKDCPWVYIFHNCGVPNDQSICPLCKKDIGAIEYNILIQRNPPQIQMPIKQGLQMIRNRIQEYNQTVRFGYFNTKTSETSSVGEKPEHLNRPISFRLIHLMTHGYLLFLQDLNYLTDQDLTEHLRLPNPKHFLDHFEKDYRLLSELLGDRQESSIWIYKLLNHLLNEQFYHRGLLNTNHQVIQLEEFIEKKLIFTHIESITNEIGEYKTAYTQFNQERDSQPSIEHFIDELFEDERQYPLLNFFNVTTFHTSNLFDEFRLKVSTLPYAEQAYPVTTFLFKRFNDYINIQHLYPIVVFTNYLIEKLNYRIKRNDAAEKKILDYLIDDQDKHITQQLYQEFLHGWYSLNLKDLQYGCQTPEFQLIHSKEKFAENTSIATVLLNTSRDESSLVLAAVIKTIAEFQNEIVNYFHNTLEDLNKTQMKIKQIPLQSIRLENILCLDQKELSQKLIDHCLVLNYQYGKSKDIIYDYEEMEMTLKYLISSLVLIDIEKLHFLNYQFELYGENSSLINDVRARIKQKQLSNDEQIKLERLLPTMNNDDVIHSLGSLDYLFTYLRNPIEEKSLETTTIQTYIQLYVQSYSCLSDHIFNRPPFSTIELQYIIHVYEIIEEYAFDQILRAYVKKELGEDSFSHEERDNVLREFSRMTFENEKISQSLKNIHTWISMLKRLMIRVLNANITLDVQLQVYLERTDLWSDRVTVDDLEKFEVPDNILLKHAYVILRGLEQKLNNRRKPIIHIQTIQEQNQRR